MDLCIFCGFNSKNCCSILSRKEKFKLILGNLKKIAFFEEEKDNLLYDIKTSLFIECTKIENVIESLNLKDAFSDQFNIKRHIIDNVSQNYLRYCDLIFVNYIPVGTIGDGNCLYHSILQYLNDENITVYELRVRVVLSMVKFWDVYENLYSDILGPLIIHIRNSVTMDTYSELYEVIALCNVLNVNIQSVYPKIKTTEHNQTQWITHTDTFYNVD